MPPTFGQQTDPEWWQPNTTGQPRKKTGNAVPDVLGAAGDEALRIRDVEESRGAATEGFLRDEFTRASQPTLTDEDIARMFTQESDAAARGQLDQEAALRANLGASGIQGGGYAAGLLSGMESQRLARVSDARTSLRITKAKTDAEDRLNRMKHATVLASQMSRDPSTAYSDFLNDSTGVVLANKGLEQEDRNAKRASKNALLGGLIKGGLGLASGFLS